MSAETFTVFTGMRWVVYDKGGRVRCDLVRQGPCPGTPIHWFDVDPADARVLAGLLNQVADVLAPSVRVSWWKRVLRRG